MAVDRKTVHVLVSGRVQGVWFRAWTQETAQGLGLSGWVRNLHTGQVEALFSGPSQDVDTMLAALWKGPPHADVSDVTSRPAPDEILQGFRVRPTG